MSPRTEAASKVSICNCLLEACVDWIGRRLSHVNWLEVGDVCLESGRTVSLEERVRDVPRAVLRSAADWRYMERVGRARGAQMDAVIKRRAVECAEYWICWLGVQPFVGTSS